ncbi:MAG: 2-oxoglutarate dehydrogenase complex dihydrolipoyllysine-residue succinyltransferase [Aeromonas sp.]
MELAIKVPDLPESVSDATINVWHKQAGERVAADEVVVSIETDKVVLDVPAPAAGVLGEILAPAGSVVQAQQVLAALLPLTETSPLLVAPSVAAVTPAPAAVSTTAPAHKANAAAPMPHLSPAVRRMVSEHELDVATLCRAEPNGRLTKADVARLLTADSAPVVPMSPPLPTAQSRPAPTRVAMSRLRQRVAERLVAAKQSTAMLTTFNEVNMAPIQALRAQYGERFCSAHGVKLGLMGLTIKALASALKRFPLVAAQIDGQDIVTFPYLDVSVAVSTPRGLVTPVLRHADHLSVAQIEQGIKALADAGRAGKLSLDDLAGGQFTVTNGGVFGSLLSTPIINPPQSAILGLHSIQERPMAVKGEVKILPMMYLALSYDHRLIDGRDAVGFLVALKELLEDPARLLLDV